MALPSLYSRIARSKWNTLILRRGALFCKKLFEALRLNRNQSTEIFLIHIGQTWLFSTCSFDYGETINSREKQTITIYNELENISIQKRHNKRKHVTVKTQSVRPRHILNNTNGKTDKEIQGWMLIQQVVPFNWKCEREWKKDSFGHCPNHF